MSPRVRTRHGEFTAELAWSGSGSWNGITPAVGRTVHYPPLLHPNITASPLNIHPLLFLYQIMATVAHQISTHPPPSFFHNSHYKKLFSGESLRLPFRRP
ncbi:hypothetical protein Hanom_Chr01g00064881 [Helianthus anomalus]